VNRSQKHAQELGFSCISAIFPPGNSFLNYYLQGRGREQQLQQEGEGRALQAGHPLTASKCGGGGVSILLHFVHLGDIMYEPMQI